MPAAKKPASPSPAQPQADRTTPSNETSSRPETRALHGWLHTARFLTTAPQLEFLPDLTVPEVAFVGRSNAGKCRRSRYGVRAAGANERRALAVHESRTRSRMGWGC